MNTYTARLMHEIGRGHNPETTFEAESLDEAERLAREWSDGQRDYPWDVLTVVDDATGEGREIWL